MKTLIYIIMCCSALALNADDIKLPISLADYEAHLERSLISLDRTQREDGSIAITVAYGDGDTVSHQGTVAVPSGSSAAAVAAACRGKNGWMLIGWAQGLVVIRSKDGDTLTRTSWSQREAKTLSSKHVMKDGDVLIGLVHGDF
jgi:hypothetical protein